MSIRTKAIAIIAATVASLVLLLGLGAERILLKRIERLEEAAAADRVETHLRYLDEALLMLDRTAEDYASWDDTYRFMDDRDPQYVASNYVEEVFRRNQIEILLLANKSGEWVFAEGYDLDYGAKVALPSGLKWHLAPGSALLSPASTGVAMKGVVLLPEGPFMIASRPVLTSQLEGPIRGAFIVGRRIHPNDFRRTADTDLSFRVFRTDDPALPLDMQGVLGRLERSGGPIAAPLDNTEMAAYGIVRDIAGEPALVIGIETTRDLFRQALHAIRYLLASLLLTGIAVTAVSTLLMHELVLHPIAGLSAAVTAIARLGNPSKRVVSKGTDEIASLADSINSMLSALEESHREIAESESRLRRLTSHMRKLSLSVESSPAAIVITDAEGKTEYVNPKFTQMTGFASGEFMGRIPRILDLDGRDEEDRRTLWQTIRSDGEWRDILRLTKKDGTPYWVSASISPVIDPDGAITNLVLVEEDITTIKAAEEAVERAREAADAANKAKSEFLANISHEIRTPLNVIVGMAEILMEGDPRPECPEQRSQLVAMQNAATNLMRLIDDILDLSKVEAGKIELVHSPFRLREMLDGACEILRVRALEKGLSVSHAVDDGVPEYLEGDADRLRQIVTNLLVNAIKFTDEGVVSLRVGPAPPAVAEGMGVAEGEVALLFSVMDTGIGISPDKMDAIFDRFTQEESSAARRYGGVGLGLTIAKRLVDLMGGRIWVESEMGRGSAFHFTARFEVTAAPSDSGARAGAAPVPSPVHTSLRESRVRVLLAEDSKDNRMLIEHHLRNTIFDLEIANNGKEAFDRYVGGRYDIVLMDVRMPVMDGYSATRAIREWEALHGRPPTPIIALTAHALKEDVSRSAEAGCAEHLSKPVGKARLLETLYKYAAAGSEEAGEPVALIDPEIEHIVPGFLENRRRDVRAILERLDTADYAGIRSIGHDMAGVGGSYGFDAISEIGRALERAAQEENADLVQSIARELESYLSRVRIVVS